MAVVIGAPNVDDPVKSSQREFVVMICDVSGKIRGISVRADQHVVFKFKSLYLLSRFSFGGKVTEMGLGSADTISLAKARDFALGFGPAPVNYCA